MTILRRSWITLVTAAVTATVLLGAGILLVGGGSSSPARVAQSTPRPPSDIGPEGVPLQRGIPLGPARSPRPGGSSGGVPCGSSEQLSYHVHARLSIFVNGNPRPVPLGVGIARPRITSTPRGDFAS